jgi:hypothetical protein
VRIMHASSPEQESLPGKCNLLCSYSDSHAPTCKKYSNYRASVATNLELQSSQLTILAEEFPWARVCLYLLGAVVGPPTGGGVSTLRLDPYYL